MRELEGLSMIVTGASSGLGREIARQAKARGARLALCGRSEERLRALAAELGGEAEDGLYLEAFDATDRSAVSAFVARAAGRLGPAEVLVNCAGANTARSRVLDMAPADLDDMLGINLFAPLFFAQAACPAMRAAGRGLVVNILSTACLFSNEGIGAYTASKRALEGLAGVLRKELRAEGIRVSSVYPGGIDTPFRSASRPDYLEARSVAEAVLALVGMDESVAPDELVLRPLVESNYA